ncbi:IS630 family transposase [Brasilonema sp. CT11]|nr:IS630 family transposase [Brasilonema sp. CT11]
MSQRVIDAYKAKQGSQRQLAERFKVSLSFVQRLIRQYRNTGQVTPLAHSGGAIAYGRATLNAKIKVGELLIVERLVDEQPDAILRELCERLATQSGINVSVPTMHRAVQRLELTTKKKHCMPVNMRSPRVKAMRFEYRDWVLGIDPNNLVFVDESGVKLGMTRLYGRAKSGERLYDSCPRNRGQNISLIGALSCDGLIATMSILGSVNTNVFVTYVRHVLAPQLWAGAIVVMDNLSVHTAAVIRDLIEAVGARLVFLPPYSPDLSPRELCWSKLKQYLRAVKARTTETLNQALTEIISEQISCDDALGWFAHCGLFM